jgi:hypothetical protein
MTYLRTAVWMKRLKQFLAHWISMPSDAASKSEEYGMVEQQEESPAVPDRQPGADAL